MKMLPRSLTHEELEDVDDRPPPPGGHVWGDGIEDLDREREGQGEEEELQKCHGLITPAYIAAEAQRGPGHRQAGNCGQVRWAVERGGWR